MVSGCTDVGKRILKAEITGEKYTILIAGLNSFKVNDYRIDRNTGYIYFTHNGNEYQSNVWTVKTTKVEG